MTPPGGPFPAPVWMQPIGALMASLGSSQTGLSEQEACSRLARHGPNSLAGPRGVHAPALLLRQFSSPIVLILVGAALLSFGLASVTDGLIILTIVVAGGLLGIPAFFRPLKDDAEGFPG